jgi:hypothetical protein
MTDRITAIHKSKYFSLLKVRHRKSDKIHYRIVCDTWNFIIYNFNMKDVRDIVDPTRCKSGDVGTQWKFRSRHEAEALFTTLLLKFE